MRVEKKIPACGRDVTVKELTVGEIRAWLAGVDGQPGSDVVNVALFEDATLDDLQRMSDLTEAEMAGATPSELAAVLALVKEVNRSFFSLRARLAMLGEAVLAQKPPPPSPPTSH